MPPLFVLCVQPGKMYTMHAFFHVIPHEESAQQAAQAVAHASNEHFCRSLVMGAVVAAVGPKAQHAKVPVGRPKGVFDIYLFARRLIDEIVAGLVLEKGDVPPPKRGYTKWHPDLQEIALQMAPHLRRPGPPLPLQPKKEKKKRARHPKSPSPTLPPQSQVVPPVPPVLLRQ